MIPIAPQPTTYLSSGIGLAEIALAIYRYKFIVIGAMLLSMGLGAAALEIMPYRYKSSAKVLIAPQQLNLESASIPTARSVLLRDTASPLQTEMYNLMSRRVLQQAVQKVGASRLASEWGLIPEVQKNADVKPEMQERLISLLEDKLDVDAISRANILEVSITTRDAKLSAELVAAIIESYLEFTVNRKMEAALATASWLQQQMLEADGKRQQAYEQLVARSGSSGLIYQNELPLLEKQADTLSRELATARTAIEQQNSRLKQLRDFENGKLDATLLNASECTGSLSRMQAEVTALNQKAAAARLNLGPQHPARIAVEKELSGLDERLKAARTDAIACAEGAADLRRSATLNIEQQLSTVMQQIDTQKAFRVQLSAIENEKTLYEKIRDQLESDLKMVTSQIGVIRPDGQILSAPQSNDEAVSPKPAKIYTASTFAMLVLAFAAIYFLESRFPSPQKLRYFALSSGIPMIGSVPMRQKVGSMNSHAYLPAAQALLLRRKAGMPKAIAVLAKGYKADVAPDVAGFVRALQTVAPRVLLISVSSGAGGIPLHEIQRLNENSIMPVRDIHGVPTLQLANSADLPELLLARPFVELLARLKAENDLIVFASTEGAEGVFSMVAAALAETVVLLLPDRLIRPEFLDRITLKFQAVRDRLAGLIVLES